MKFPQVAMIVPNTDGNIDMWYEEGEIVIVFGPAGKDNPPHAYVTSISSSTESEAEAWPVHSSFLFFLGEL